MKTIEGARLFVFVGFARGAERVSENGYYTVSWAGASDRVLV